MAFLTNRSAALRFALRFIQKEKGSERVLGSAEIEYLDRRDNSYWPVLRLPVLYIHRADGLDISDAVKDLCRKGRDGFSVTLGADQELAIQMARTDEDVFLVELGMDLASVFSQVSGKQSAVGEELSLFRLLCHTRDLVVFASQLREEAEALANA